MMVLAAVLSISCVVGAVYGGCHADSGQELLTYDDEYKEPLKSPIQKVVRDVATKKVECIVAYITIENIDKGTSPNPKTQAFAKKLGYPEDQAGHLIAKILGGTGYRIYNIVPQSRKSNTSSEWRTKVERAIRNKVRDENVNATFIVQPQYDSNIHPTRPYKLKYSFTFTDGTGDSGSVDNIKP